MSTTATAVDFSAEIAAAERGECLACRIGARHRADSGCPGAKRWADHWCAKGGHDYPKSISPRTGGVVKAGPCRHCRAR